MQQNRKIKRQRPKVSLSLEQRALEVDAQLAYLGRVNYCALWHTRSGFASKRGIEIDCVISEFDRALAGATVAITQLKTELAGLRARSVDDGDGV